MVLFKTNFILTFFILHIQVKNLEIEKDYYTNFAVNTELDLASEIGKRIILKGGNAVDASIAAAITIGVVNSFSSGIGGGGFMLIKMKNKDNKKNDIYDMIDFREVAPDNTEISEYIKNPSYSKVSGLSVAVPGEVMGFYLAHKKYGKLPWEDLFTDNIELAKGFPASKILVEKLEASKEYVFADPGLKAIFTRNNEIIKEGDIISRRNYSHTLKIISKDPLSFYNGQLAKDMVKFINKNNGTFKLSDFKNYKAITREVIKTQFYDYKVYTTNLPTSGPFIATALKILERINIRDMNFLINQKNSYYMYHILIETLKFINAAKEDFEDPAFMSNLHYEISRIISDPYAYKIMRKFKMNQTLSETDYGFQNILRNDHGTTHLNVIDKDENIVLITSTINLVFGSKLLDPKTGIIFNNHMNDFFIPETNNYNKKTRNILEKGKRPMSSASPIILEKDDDILVVGGAGGARIVSSIVFFIGYFMAGNSIEDCIRFCRIHTQLYPNQVLIEPNLNENITEKLKLLGHSVLYSDINTNFTSVQAIRVLKATDGNKMIYAVSDKRKQGGSAGE